MMKWTKYYLLSCPPSPPRITSSKRKTEKTANDVIIQQSAMETDQSTIYGKGESKPWRFSLIPVRGEFQMELIALCKYRYGNFIVETPISL